MNEWSPSSFPSPCDVPLLSLGFSIPQFQSQPNPKLFQLSHSFAQFPSPFSFSAKRVSGASPLFDRSGLASPGLLRERENCFSRERKSPWDCRVELLPLLLLLLLLVTEQCWKWRRILIPSWRFRGIPHLPMVLGMYRDPKALLLGHPRRITLSRTLNWARSMVLALILRSHTWTFVVFVLWVDIGLPFFLLYVCVCNVLMDNTWIL